MAGRERNIQDIVDISGLHRAARAAPIDAARPRSDQPASPADRPADATPPPAGPRTAFLSVWFRCCHVYGRMYRNPQGTRYDGRCPSCGAKVHATIGPGGTNQRAFEAR